jgi:hypothetical protein
VEALKIEKYNIPLLAANVYVYEPHLPHCIILERHWKHEARIWISHTSQAIHDGSIKIAISIMTITDITP